MQVGDIKQNVKARLEPGVRNAGQSGNFTDFTAAVKFPI